MFRQYFQRVYRATKFTRNHEWVDYRPEDKSARVGITDHAQEQLGQIIFVEMPAIGRQVQSADSTAVIESVKIAADVYAPLAGEVTAINSEVVSAPSLINQHPHKSWLFELKVSAEPQDLMTEEEYKSFLDHSAH